MRVPTIWKQDKDMRPVTSLFDDFLKNAFYRPEEDERMMAMDVVEKNDEFRLKANLPGIKKNDIKVYIDGSDFVIEAKRQKKEKKESETTYREERYQGNYRRAFSIPDTWDVKNIKANFKDGVLHINIPKKAAEPEKQITVS